MTMNKFHFNEHKQDTWKGDWLIGHIISITPVPCPPCIHGKGRPSLARTEPTPKAGPRDCPQDSRYKAPCPAAPASLPTTELVPPTPAYPSRTSPDRPPTLGHRPFIGLPLPTTRNSIGSPKTPIWSACVDRPCHLRTISLASTDRARTPQVSFDPSF